MAKPQERPKPFDPAGAHLLAAWRQLGLTTRQAYNCVEATRQMAGHNSAAQTEGLRSELTTKIQRTSDQLSSKIESQGQELSARIESQVRELSAKIDRQGQRLSARIDRQGQRLSARIDRQGQQLSARIDRQGQQLSARIEDQGQQLSAKIEDQGQELRAEIARLDQRHGSKIERLVGAFRVQQSMIWALIGILATAVLGILAAMLLRTQAGTSSQPSAEQDGSHAVPCHGCSGTSRVCGTSVRRDRALGWVPGRSAALRTRSPLPATAKPVRYVGY